MLTPSRSEPGIVVRPAELAGFALALLVVLVIIGLSPLSAHKDALSTGDGNLLRQGLYIGIFGFVLVTSRALQSPRLLFCLPLTMWVLMLWCLFSLSWSIQGAVGLRRLFLTFLIIWTVFIAVERAGFERTVKSIQVTLIGILFVNYAFVILYPGIAIHDIADVVDPGLIGDWRGALPQKNFAGAVCAITMILFLFYGRWMNVALRWGTIAASAYFLFRSGSKTSISVGILSIGVGILYTGYSPRYRALLVPLVLMLGAAVVFAGQFYWSDIANSLLTGNALTGRSSIWAVLLNYAQDHWLLGTGFGSFWNIGTSSPVYFYTETWVNKLGNGHNGYLDLLITIGAPGLLLAVVAMVLDPLWRLFASRSLLRPRGALLVALVIFCAGHNFTESSLLDRDMIVQFFLVVTIALTLVATRKPRSVQGFLPLYWAWSPVSDNGRVSTSDETGQD